MDTTHNLFERMTEICCVPCSLMPLAMLTACLMLGKSLSFKSCCVDEFLLFTDPVLDLGLAFPENEVKH